MYLTWSLQELCAILGQTVQGLLSLLHPSPSGDSLWQNRFVPTFSSRTEAEKMGRNSYSIDFSHSNRKVWSTINKLSGRSGRSSWLCTVSANSNTSQLEKNRTQRTGSPDYQAFQLGAVHCPAYGQWCVRVIFVESESSQSHKPFESESSKNFSSWVRVVTWSERVRVESHELSSHFESLVCKLESMSSRTKTLWWMCDSTRTGCAWRTTSTWGEQAEIRLARRGIFITAWCHSRKLCALAALLFQSHQSGAVTRMWRWCQVQPSQKERAISVVYCENEGTLLQFLGWRCFKVWFSHTQYMKMTWDENVLGFKSCNISIYWWIWILSFLLKQNWIGNDYFLWNSSQLSVQFWDCRLL